MDITFKSIDYSPANGKEGGKYMALICVDGVLRGSAESRGKAGDLVIRPDALRTEIAAHLAGKSRSKQSETPESFIARMVNEQIAQHRLEVEMRTKVLFTRPGERGVFSYQLRSAKSLAVALSLPHLKRLLGAAKILNTMERPSALKVYMAAT